MKKQAVVWALALGLGAGALAVRAEDAGKIYAAKCQSCHGKDGKGNPAMTKVLKADAGALSLVDDASLAKTDAELVKITLDGVGKMPKYQGKLTEADVQAVTEYVRALKPAPAK